MIPAKKFALVESKEHVPQHNARRWRMSKNLVNSSPVTPMICLQVCRSTCMAGKSMVDTMGQLGNS